MEIVNKEEIIMEKAFVLLTTEIGFEEDVLEFLKDIPEVKETFSVYGVYDTILKVEADTRDDLKGIVRKIRQMGKVQSTLTMIVI